MAVYAIVQLSIHDRERYLSYSSKFMPILAKYQGRLLAVDESPEVVEGSWDYEKVVLLSFADEEGFRRWAYSPEYQEISKDRWAATTGVALLAKGWGG